jgi:hypothetical protein
VSNELPICLAVNKRRSRRRSQRNRRPAQGPLTALHGDGVCSQLTLLHNPHKVAFAKDANALAPGRQLFGFAVLGTLFMTGEPAQVLIAYN